MFVRIKKRLPFLKGNLFKKNGYAILRHKGVSRNNGITSSGQ